MKIALKVISVRSSYIEGLSDVILIDRSSNTVICIPVGEFEARLIALSVDKKDLPKPMMFESFVSIISYFGVEVKYVLIDSFRDGVYGAKVYCSSEKENGLFNTRVSDAINLALKADCSIYIKDAVLKEVGFDADVLLEKEPIVEEVNVCSKVSDLDLEMLEDLLEDAVENEDYELAVLLRDKINELKGREKGDV